MPLVRVSLRHGKPATHHQAILDGIYAALRENFNVPADDYFMIVSEHDETALQFNRTYLGIARSDDLVIIQLTVSNTRDIAQKKALYRGIAAALTKDPGLRPEDIFINLVEVLPENWSFGHGLAQYV